VRYSQEIGLILARNHPNRREDRTPAAPPGLAGARSGALRGLSAALLAGGLFLSLLVGCGPVRIGRAEALAGQPQWQPRPHALAAGTSDPAPLPIAAHVAEPFECLPNALTCVRIESEGNRRSGPVPVTFGLPFAPGVMPRGKVILARVPDGSAVPIQMDEDASNPDHSLGFTVLSLVLPNLPSRGEVVSLFEADQPALAGPPMAPSAVLEQGHDTRVVLNVYSSQVSVILPGNRNGNTPGTPFRIGDTISLHLGDDPADVYTVTVGKGQAGGDFGAAKNIAIAFINMINKGEHFTATRGWEEFYVTTKNGPPRAFPVRIDSTAQAPVTATLIQPYEAPHTYMASSRAMLTAAANGGDLRRWLSGPVATEFSMSAPLVDAAGARHPRLTARMNMRLYNGVAAVRTDVEVEDLWTYDPGARNWQYDVEIDQDGKPVFRQADVTHYHHARWHRVVWSDNETPPFVQYDKHYLLNSRAVPHYDETLSVPASVVDDETRALAKSDTGIMGNALVTLYFGMTGGRADIAPLPRWTVLYLLTMNPAAYAVMMANADAAGSVPIHFRDRKTGRPVSIDDHPGIVMGTWPPAEPADKLPPQTNDKTPWSPEPAHQPSLVYVPYLVTGDEYYMEEVQFWANWNFGALDPAVRLRSEGIVVQQGQTRGQAWALRAIADAAWITPDSDPSKAYFQAKLANNIKFILARYAQRTNPLGLDAILHGQNFFAPWQLDFLALSVSEIAGHGYPGADTWLHWLSEFDVGRFNNEQKGFCRTDGPSYYLTFETKVGGPQFQTWSELSTTNFPKQTSCPTKLSFDASPLGYVANAMASMAAQADLNIPGAREAYDFLNQSEPRMAFSSDPTWRIVPR
jgi:hypothetical protein